MISSKDVYSLLGSIIKEPDRKKELIKEHVNYLLDIIHDVIKDRKNSFEYFERLVSMTMDKSLVELKVTDDQGNVLKNDSTYINDLINILNASVQILEEFKKIDGNDLYMCMKFDDIFQHLSRKEKIDLALLLVKPLQFYTRVFDL